MFVVNRDLFARLNVAQGDEEDVAIKDLHEGVGLAGMIDVMRAVSIAAAVEAPAIVDAADAQLTTAGPAPGLSVGDLLAGVFRYLPPAPEVSN